MEILNENSLIVDKKVRDRYIGRDAVLDKVKALPTLPDKFNVTTGLAANYYEVDVETMKKVINRNMEELSSDGLKVIRGEDLKLFKTSAYDGDINSLPSDMKRASVLTLIPRRALLRIGMLLRDSLVAKQVRDYLIDSEEKAVAVAQGTTVVQLYGDVLDRKTVLLERYVKMAKTLGFNNADSNVLAMTAIKDGLSMEDILMQTVNDARNNEIEFKKTAVRHQIQRISREYGIEPNEAWHAFSDALEKKTGFSIQQDRANHGEDNKTRYVDYLEKYGLLDVAIKILLKDKAKSEK